MVAQQLKVIAPAIPINDLIAVDTWLKTACRRAIDEACQAAQRWNGQQARAHNQVHIRLKQALEAAPTPRAVGAAEQGDLGTLKRMSADGCLEPFDAERALVGALREGHFTVAQWLLPRADRHDVLGLVWEALHGVNHHSPPAAGLHLGKTVTIQLIGELPKTTPPDIWANLISRSANGAYLNGAHLDVIQVICQQARACGMKDEVLKLGRALDTAVSNRDSNFVRWLVTAMQVDPTPTLDGLEAGSDLAAADYLATLVDREVRRHWLAKFDDLDTFPLARALLRLEDRARERAERALTEPLAADRSRGARARP
jgi:hypothetical protein